MSNGKSEPVTSSAEAVVVELPSDQRPSGPSSEKGVHSGIEPAPWVIYPPGKAYRFFGIVKYDDRRLSGEVPALPGIYAYADCLKDVMQRLREAAAAAIESYLAGGEEIPWQQDAAEDIPKEGVAFAGWLEVHV